MESIRQSIGGRDKSDADIKAFLDRLRTTAEALDAALHDARRFGGQGPPVEMPADRAA
jgi:hypothetical protein